MGASPKSSRVGTNGLPTTCTCASVSPGTRYCPVQSTIVAPAGKLTSDVLPIAAMRSPRTSTVWPRLTPSRSSGTTLAFVKAMAGGSGTWADAGADNTDAKTATTGGARHRSFNLELVLNLLICIVQLGLVRVPVTTRIILYEIGRASCRPSLNSDAMYGGRSGPAVLNPGVIHPAGKRAYLGSGSFEPIVCRCRQ